MRRGMGSIQSACEIHKPLSVQRSLDSIGDETVNRLLFRHRRHQVDSQCHLHTIMYPTAQCRVELSTDVVAYRASGMAPSTLSQLP